MIECRRCGCKHTKVTHTYRKDGRYRGKQITVIRRRRSCRYCGLCWFTTEHLEDLDDWEKPKTGDALETKPEPNEETTEKPKDSSTDKSNPYLPDD